jgi:hypothetical protein
MLQTHTPLCPPSPNTSTPRPNAPRWPKSSHLPLPIPLPLFLLAAKRDLNLLHPRPQRLPRSVAEGLFPSQHAVAAAGGEAGGAALGLGELDEGVVVVGVFLAAALLGEAFGRGVG